MHNPPSLRPVEHERLALGNGSATHGCWACSSHAPVLPPDHEWVGRPGASYRHNHSDPRYDSRARRAVERAEERAARTLS